MLGVSCLMLSFLYQKWYFARLNSSLPWQLFLFFVSSLKTQLANVNTFVKCISHLSRILLTAENRRLILKVCFHSRIPTFHFAKPSGNTFCLVCIPVAFFISCSCVKSSNSKFKEWNRLPYNIYTIWLCSLRSSFVWK